jgi:hypothetical protein
MVCVGGSGVVRMLESAEFLAVSKRTTGSTLCPSQRGCIERIIFRKTGHRLAGEPARHVAG